MDGIIQTINSLPLEYVKLSTYIVGGIVILLLACAISTLIKTGQLKRTTTAWLQNSNDYISKKMGKSKNKGFNYESVESFITRTGFTYMTKDKVSPVGYIILKMVLAVFGFVVGIQIHILAGPVLGLICYLLLDFILNESNKGDNTKMLSDIKSIYDTLRIQTKAGVYITSVLAECYLVVENKRLKAALLQLTSDIIAKNDIADALEKFRSKFSNEYINTLAIIIKQSLQTGQASKMFTDIRGQIKDLEAAIVEQEKKRIQTKITMVQMLLYVSIILVSVYIAMNTLGSGLDF